MTAPQHPRPANSIYLGNRGINRLFGAPPRVKRLVSFPPRP